MRRDVKGSAAVIAVAGSLVLALAGCSSPAGSNKSGGSGGAASGSAGMASGGDAGTAGSAMGGAGGSMAGGGSGGAAGSSGSAGSAGSGGCQNFDLELGETDAQGVTLLYEEMSVRFLTGLGFVGEHLYLIGGGTADIADLRLIRISLTDDVVEELDEFPSTTTILVGDDLIWHEGDVQNSTMGELKTAKIASVAQSTVLATTRSMETVAADAQNVYFYGYSPDEVYRVPRSGGPAELLYEGARTEGALVPAGDQLYFFDVDANSLMRIPAIGGTAEPLLDDISAPGSAIASSEGLFWSETGRREIRYFPFDGTASTLIVGDLEDSAAHLVLNGDELLWETGTFCNEISRLDAAGTAAESIASGFDLTTWMGVHQGRLYVTDQQHAYRLDL